MKNLNKIYLFLASLCLLSLHSLAAQNNTETEADSDLKQAIIIEYLVQDGDTLSELTTRYLGDPTLWQLNADINPELDNFDYLKPGSKIRLITGYEVIEPEVEAAQAEIEIISNEVGKSLQRSDWQEAKTGDELQPNDGVRTQDKSSAVIIFVENTGSQSRVQISENSRLFISNEKKENGITRNEIEIEKGEAELKIDSSAATDQSALNEFEIIIGEVKTKPVLDATGQLSTKARLAGDDKSQIMVYSGNSEVESGGISVDVETGMGTIAKSGEAPSPPEKLLSAPELSDDNPTEIIVNESATVNWSPIEGVANYKLVLCEDQNCSKVFRTETELKTNSITLNALPSGTVHWQVSGISPSGLDGFASKSQSIKVSELPPEPEAIKIPWYLWLVGLLYIYYFIKILALYLTGK